MAEERFIVVGSDGIWDRFSNEEVMRLVVHNGFWDRKDPSGAVKKLVQDATDKWLLEQQMIDDITCIIAFFGRRQA